ncbi:MAG: MoxR family ATPase [Spirochaetales bacterium]|uniref:MoxR family ATPase n=1 Tax=Candidatus Thalassospirochaeta sargassi TaxID=3119039 RepID=A0AAJ1IFR6_9SPIO|nr:MoxR family ATPase [Spirochaetales bacterium]
MSDNQPIILPDKSIELPKELKKILEIEKEIRKVLIGQDKLVNRLLIGLICNQHVLIEGVPGLAKTLSVSSLSQTLGLDFNRIQFTPDLLPADIIGTQIYNPKTGDFSPKKGPIFSNIILADEINRAPAKVQSALLESMQERQVTIGDETWKLNQPFMVMATQNPVEQEGTYQLPEAQVDRFMLKVNISYPDRAEELRILRLMAKSASVPEIETVASADDILKLRDFLDSVHMEPAIEEYIVDLIQAGREPEVYGIEAGHLIKYGASPRATIYLTMAAKAYALLKGRMYVVPGDVLDIAYDVLRHRIIPSYEAEAEGLSSENVIRMIIEKLPMP